MSKILLVDDDKLEMIAISINLKKLGFSPIEATSGAEAIKIFQQEKVPLVLLDLNMPGMDGIETLQELKKIDPFVAVIILTGYSDIPTVVEAVKLGAYDFIIKPPDYDRLALTLNRAREQFDLNNKVKMLSSEIEVSLEYMCGKSEAMKNITQQVHRISQSDFSLIIQGETGTGKSFIARYIHNLSKRAKGPLVIVDIGAIPESLVESELFGYEKGAFTGAEKKKKGFFEIADGGTLLIDELQNLSPYTQSKLLMAAEEKIIIPLGSTSPVKVDVRIIGATNTNILKSVKETKEFREDLFYRLSEFMIFLPTLKERKEDISFLAEKFFREAAEDLNKHVHTISGDTLKVLKNYSWPGNIRELKNVIRRAVLFADEVIKPEHLEILREETNVLLNNEILISSDESPLLDLKKIEKNTIIKALDFTKGNKKKAASLLKISYVTLFKKIKDYSIS